MNRPVDNKNAPSEKELQRMDSEGGSSHGTTASPDIKVLLVDGAEPEALNIKAFLQASTAPSFHVYYYASPQEAAHFLQENHVDVVLLNFGALYQHNAEEVFQKIRDASRDRPIIIFTGETEHDLALLIMREGADDRMTREQFVMSPEHLREAIELSLARREALASGMLREIRKKGAMELRISEEKGATELQEAQKKGAAALLGAEEKGAAELKKAQEESASELDKMNKERLSDLRNLKQTLSWMSGGYSIDSAANAQEIENTDSAWQFIADELKEAQRKYADELKETQRKEAVNVQSANQEKAAILKTKQREEAEQLQKSQGVRPRD